MFAKKLVSVFKGLNERLKLTIIILIFLVFWFGIGLFKEKNKHTNSVSSGKGNIVVLAQKEVEKDTFKEIVVYGRVDRNRIDVTAQLNSHVEKVFLKEGIEVKQGQPVIELMNDIHVPSPINGKLDKINVKKGEIVFSGQSVLFSVISKDTLDAIVYLSATDIRAIKSGQNAIIETEGKSYKGKVYFVSKTSDKNTNTFEVKIKIDKKSADGLYDKESIKVTIQMEKKKGFFIPTSSITTNKEGDIIIKYINKEDIAEEVKVEILQTHNNGIWVSAKNMPQEAIIITRGADFVKTGERASYKLAE